MKHQKKPVRRSRLALDQRDFVKARGETNLLVIQRILSRIKTYNLLNRNDLIREVALNHALPNDFNPLFPPGSVFHGAVDIYSCISPRNYPSWLVGLFEKNSDAIKDFLRIKSMINGYILKNDANNALILIQEINKISQNWWCVETHIHILKELLSEDTKGIIKNLEIAHPNLRIANHTKDLLLLSEPNSINLYTRTVLGRINEYRSSSIESAIEHGDVESCEKLPINFDRSRLPKLGNLRDYCDWSIFDQYLLWREVLIEGASAGRPNVEWLDSAKNLSEKIGDTELLNALKPSQDLDYYTQEVVEKYTQGRYQDVLSLIKSELFKGDLKVSALIEIYARCKIYTGNVGNGTSFFDKLADELANVLTLEPKSRESAIYLHRVCVKFRKEGWARSLLFHLSSLQASCDSATLEILRRQTSCLGIYNTPKAKINGFVPNLSGLKADQDIPEHRMIRYASSAENEKKIEADFFPIYSDFLKTKCSNFLANNRIYEAISFVIDEYLKRSMAVDHLPVRQLCEYVIELEQNNESDYILSLVVLDIYSKEKDATFEEQKNELFEDFMANCKKFRPSEIFTATSINAASTYFLRHLCVPAQLDNIIQFQNNDEVIHERVAIIDFLISQRVGNVDDLRAERDKVLENLFSEKLRAKIESGKLYVDIQAMESHRRHVYIDLYEKAKTIEGGIRLEPLGDDWEVASSKDMFTLHGKVPLAIPSSKKTSILLKIFVQATKDFALNENYGLDKYLSAEVRHVVFVSQLRACFEKHNLLTVQRDGQYISNIYWAQQYSYVSSEILDDLDTVLKIFSSNVDKILTGVNDRFRVKLDETSPDHIFDFGAYHDRVVRISKIVTASDSFEEFFSSLIEFMWELAIDSARAAQQIIDNVMAKEVLELIDQLELSIDSIKRDAAMADLMREIRNARSDFKKEIELVLNWFRFVGSEKIQTFERLGVVIEAAVSSFQSIFYHRGKQLIFTQQRSALSLNYGEAKSLFISLFTALENALKYGTSDSPVKITHYVDVGRDVIAVENKIEREIKNPIEFAENQRAKWNAEYSSLSREEGGTGLYKIYNLLTNSSIGFHFDVNVQATEFKTLMELKHEYFNNRG